MDLNSHFSLLFLKSFRISFRIHVAFHTPSPDKNSNVKVQNQIGKYCGK
ncbi:hypothetical protein LEP1GSC103_0980 [Leptospira borgpetersenii serovar Javanica str. UI 09931]|uniref:Uncharacterized protein n=4 Tax=Leptospira borgpetersenii TaxID=174 RepID=M3FF55_LEPBO|nr:hypothetical protein LEP1GSC128_4070 [Leptospira borgpetersenii str. 200801926]EKQ90544.1 hypothetical protein LEP1GSC101_0195 [Leptospira borgpetersenii str. UI 09149]EMG00493.1 hypothetical protein LEP1GSC123_4045 [Leptospira borgpetersenii str. 200701203]EMK11882.1 hypothetical protein LEP1GSC066_2261 [Leptospira sp. serovar Kenya str. Sh9]EMN13301.1 hypothetical protein LEP1GSC055_1172 [Leptospira borgpetersenii str. Brem 307]EMN17387.1 hypothetical protein LEP1GSC056_3856 [Leptospira b